MPLPIQNLFLLQAFSILLPEICYYMINTYSMFQSLQMFVMLVMALLPNCVLLYVLFFSFRSQSLVATNLQWVWVVSWFVFWFFFFLPLF